MPHRPFIDWFGRRGRRRHFDDQSGGKMSGTDAPRILVIRGGAIGDFVLTLPVLDRTS